MADQDLRPHLARAGWVGCLEAAVNADHPREISPASGHFEHCPPAKAVAHGGDAPVDAWIGCEHLDAGEGALAELVTTPEQARDGGHHSLAIADHARAVHIAGERHESEVGELPRAALGVIVQSGAAVNDEDSGTGEFAVVPD